MGDVRVGRTQEIFPVLVDTSTWYVRGNRDSYFFTRYLQQVLVRVLTTRQRVWPDPTKQEKPRTEHPSPFPSTPRKQALELRWLQGHHSKKLVCTCQNSDMRCSWKPRFSNASRPLRTPDQNVLSFESPTFLRETFSIYWVKDACGCWRWWGATAAEAPICVHRGVGPMRVWVSGTLQFS